MCVGNIDVEFHGHTDQRTTLTDVSYIPGLGFNLYSVHAVSRTNLVLFDPLGAYVIGTKITFPRSDNGVTRLPIRTVGEKRKLNEVCSTDLLKHGRTVDISHLHVSLGHVHDEILR